MCDLYNILLSLCEEKNITGYRMCKDCGISPGIMTDLKAGRKKTLSAVNMQKIADYFGVSVGYLLDDEPQKEKPVISDGLTGDQKKALDLIKSMTPEELKALLTIIDR